MNLILMGISVVLIILALAYFNKKISEKKLKDLSKSQNNSNDKKVHSKCPICSSNLVTGENLFSKVYKPMNVPDQRCTISGCPHCYPSCENGVKRVCPVCHAKISESEYLIARLFNKTNTKKHVIVSGCTKCLKGFSKKS